jgi:diguanylate cyclase (GGDEF)-like protein
MSVFADSRHLLSSRILVVDDEPWSVRLALAALREFADVRSAASAAEAQRLIDERLPDLILLDAQMPGEGGLQFCRALKEDPARRDIPIIFVTAQSELEFELEALAAGAADFVGKPYSFARLQLRVLLHLKLKWQIDQLQELSLTDPLTGLANRRSFERALLHEAARAGRIRRPLSLVLFDVDYFKRYNDTHGHLQGDDCLRRVAAVALSVAQRRTDMVARYGGEEFVLLLPDVGAGIAGRMAARLQQALGNAQIAHGASPVSEWVTVSCGVASMNDPAAGGEARATVAPETLIQAADEALYAAKRLGRNRAEHVHVETR